MLRKIALLTLLALPALSAPVSQAADLPKAAYLPLDLAERLARAAIDQCRKDGWQVGVVVVDAAGVPRTLLRDDKAGPHTVETAAGKAYTAASLGFPSGHMAQVSVNDPAMAAIRHMHPKMVILGGGLPLIVGGERVGAIGISGAPGSKLDEACAQAAIEKLLGR